MSNSTSNDVLVSSDAIKSIDFLAMSLLSMNEFYELPKAVDALVQELQLQAETLNSFRILNN